MSMSVLGPQDDNVDLSIVVACYQEEPHLAYSVRQIEKFLQLTRLKYEMIFVDDCSRDNTRDIIKKVCEGKENYRYYFNEKNIGRGGTVQKGMAFSKGRIVGFMDIDLEVHVRYLLAMVVAIELEGHDVAIASRVYRLQMSFSFLLRHVLSIGYRLIVKAYIGLDCEDPESGYKFFHRDALEEILSRTKNEGWFWDTEVMMISQLLELRIAEIPALFLRRHDKQSTVRIFHDIIQYFKDLYRFKKNFEFKK